MYLGCIGSVQSMGSTVVGVLGDVVHTSVSRIGSHRLLTLGAHAQRGLL